MKNIRCRIGVAVIVSIVSLSALIGCKGQESDTPTPESQPLSPLSDKISTFEYWVNPNLSTKIRVTLTMPVSSPENHLELRSQIIRLMTNTPAVEAWSDMAFQVKDKQGVFSATGWARDLSEVRFHNAHLIPSRSGDNDLVLSVQFGRRAPKLNSTPVPPSSNRSDQEIAQAVKTFRVELDKDAKKIAARLKGFQFPAWRIIVHAPGKLAKNTNFQREGDGPLSVDFSFQRIMDAFRHVFMNNDDVAKKLLRETNVTSPRDLRKHAAKVRAIALTQLWGQPSMPELTATDLSSAKPLFDYDAGVNTAKAVALDVQLAKIGLVKLSLTSATEPAAVTFNKDRASPRTSTDHWTGKPDRSVTIPVEFAQNLTDLPSVTLHRITDDQSRVLFPAFGVEARAYPAGSYSSRLKKMRHNVQFGLVGEIKPHPQTIDILAEVRYTTGTKRKTTLAFPAIKPGATDDKAYNARITKVEREGDQNIIHFALNIPKGSRFDSIGFDSNDGKSICDSGWRSDPYGNVECIRRIAAKDMPRIKTIYIIVFDNYKEHVYPVHLKNIPFKK